PIALLIDQLAFTGRARDHLPDWWDRVVAPLISLCLVLTILYFLGYFVRTRIARLLDWSMSRVPGVTIVYQSIRDIFHVLDHQRQDKRPQRVVLLPFPLPGARAIALATKTLRAAETQKTILCVYVVTALMPPAGFTLFIPEEEVTEVAVT